MKKLVVGTFVAAFVSSAVLLSDGVATADDVVVVPGTAPPSGPAKKFYHFKPEWIPKIAGNYYSNPGVTNNPGTPGVKPKIVTYPQTNPTSLNNTMPVGKSVAIGADNLDAAIHGAHGPMTIVGLSQGSEVITEEQLRLSHDPTAPPPDQITFIKVSDPAIVLRRLFRPGTHLPIFDYTVPPPVESQYNTVNVVAEYDFVGDPPDRWTNLIAVINSGMGLQHSMVAFSDPANVPPENITTTVNSKGATVTTYRVPEQEMPLTGTLRGMGVPNPVADRLDPVIRGIVDEGYKRNNPNPIPGMNVHRDMVSLANAIGDPEELIPAITVPAEGGKAEGPKGLNVGTLVSQVEGAVTPVPGTSALGAASGGTASAGNGAKTPAPGADKGLKATLAKISSMLPKGKGKGQAQPPAQAQN